VGGQLADLFIAIERALCPLETRPLIPTIPHPFSTTHTAGSVADTAEYMKYSTRVKSGESTEHSSHESSMNHGIYIKPKTKFKSVAFDFSF
jgi:hypothetical protein